LDDALYTLLVSFWLFCKLLLLLLLLLLLISCLLLVTHSVSLSIQGLAKYSASRQQEPQQSTDTDVSYTASLRSRLPACLLRTVGVSMTMQLNITHTLSLQLSRCHADSAESNRSTQQKRGCAVLCPAETGLSVLEQWLQGVPSQITSEVSFASHSESTASQL
jgi:hypothetical protein